MTARLIYPPSPLDAGPSLPPPQGTAPFCGMAGKCEPPEVWEFVYDDSGMDCCYEQDSQRYVHARVPCKAWSK